MPTSIGATIVGAVAAIVARAPFPEASGTTRIAIGPTRSSTGDVCAAKEAGSAKARSALRCFLLGVFFFGVAMLRAYHPSLLFLVACGAAPAADPAASQQTPVAEPPAAAAPSTTAPPPVPTAPAAPPPTCDARSYGAKGDGTTKDTVALQAAIDACAGKGGKVVLANGTFLSGMLVLKSDVTLFLEPTATLKGTQDDADYPTQRPPTTNTQLLNCRKALVYAESAKNVTITGGGTIDGNGNVGKWLGPSTLHPEATRPMAIYTALSENVVIDGITVKNAAMWGVVNLEVEKLRIANVTIDTPLSGNRDGIDVVDGHHVTIENVTVTSEDDSICIKSGSARGVLDVTVRNSHVKRSIVANGLKFGTASYGSFKDVLFENVLVENVDKAAMAVESVDGADVSNIVFRNVTVHGAGSPFFVILGDRGTTPSGSPHKVGTIDGVRFEHVTVDGAKYTWASPISGTKLADGSIHAIANLAFDDVHVSAKGGLGSVPADPPEYDGRYPDPNLWGDMPGWGWFVRHATNVTFTSVTAAVSPTDARPKLVARDVVDLTAP
jgi:hypothetical protein